MNTTREASDTDRGRYAVHAHGQLLDGGLMSRRSAAGRTCPRRGGSWSHRPPSSESPSLAVLPRPDDTSVKGEESW